MSTTSDPWKPSFSTCGRTAPWSRSTFGIQLSHSVPPVQRLQRLLCCPHGYGKGVCSTSVSLWLHTVKLTLSLVYLGIKNIWGVFWLNQPFPLGPMHEPSLFLFLTLCKSTTVVANKWLDVLPNFFFFFSFLIGSCSEQGRRCSPGVISSLLIRFIIWSLFLSSSTWPLSFHSFHWSPSHSLSYQLIVLNTHQHNPLITFLYSL